VAVAVAVSSLILTVVLRISIIEAWSATTTTTVRFSCLPFRRAAVASPVRTAVVAMKYGKKPSADDNNGGGVLRTSVDSALAIVPPDEAWDTLQRARYIANDKSYTRWPPALRLFHPFVADAGDVALRIAGIVEKLGIEPFEVRLTEWTIVPHAEVLHNDWKAMQQMGPSSSMSSSPSSSGGSSGATTATSRNEKEQRAVEDLIRRQELEGRRNKRRRELRKRLRLMQQQSDNPSFEELLPLLQQQKSLDEPEEVRKRLRLLQQQGDVSLEEILPLLQELKSLDEADDRIDEDGVTNDIEQEESGAQQPQQDDSPRALLEKQKRMYEEFNGPCVVCLEPDEESKERLIRLRQILQQELFGDDDGGAEDDDDGTSATTCRWYSPTLSVTPPSLVVGGLPPPLADQEVYRPLVPVAAFPTVSSALQIARKLSKIWEPLAFNVTDLQLMSCSSSTGSPSSGGPGLHHNWWRSTVGQEQESHLANSPQFGCDALVMLIGEEMQMDVEGAQEMAQMVYEKGERGGAGMSDAEKSTRDQGNFGSGPSPFLDELHLDKEDGDTSELLEWLDSDHDEDYDFVYDSDDDGGDNWDDGTVFVIGRTHFFTGQQRLYVGMPATSSTDAKDRVLGDSGAAKRRGAVHRSTTRRRADGEWGRVEEDFEPWSNREQKRMGRQDALDKMEKKSWGID